MPNFCAWCGRPLPSTGFMTISKGPDKGKSVHFFFAPADCRPPVKEIKKGKKTHGKDPDQQ